MFSSLSLFLIIIYHFFNGRRFFFVFVFFAEEEEIDVVNDSWDTPDPPRKGATMADIMKRGIVKKRDPPVTKWKNTVKRKHKTTAASTAAVMAATYPMPPPPPKKLCGGLSLLDRYKKDTNWKDVVIKDESIIKDEPDDDEVDPLIHAIQSIKPEPLDDEFDDDYDMDADFESLMKNEPEDLFDDEYDDYNDDENDMDWEKMMRNGGSGVNMTSGSTNGRGHRKSSGGSSSCSSSSSSVAVRKKRKMKKKSSKSSSKHHHQTSSGSSSSGSSSGKKIKYDSGGYSYKTKLMDPVKRALHNDLEKSRRVETSMLFMNLSMQVSFLDDNRKIPSKLSILRGAKRECDLMMIDERRLLSEKHVMQQKQRMLRERLFELRRDHYHRRYGKNTPKH